MIRGAGPEDASAIAGIYNEAVRTTVATFDTEPRSVPHQVVWIEEHLPRYPVLVAQRSSVITGWASLSPWSDRKAYDGTAEVSVYVLGTERGKGIGKRLLAGLVERGRAMGLHTLLARIADGNEVSLHLHESIGFLRIGIMREVGWKFGRWVDVNLLQDPGTRTQWSRQSGIRIKGRIDPAPVLERDLGKAVRRRGAVRWTAVHHGPGSERTSSSISLPRAGAKPFSSPQIPNPHFSRTRIDAWLSLATRA